jgi:hypothetical protein
LRKPGPTTELKNRRSNVNKTLALALGSLTIIAATPAAAAPAAAPDNGAAQAAAGFTDADIEAYVTATADVMKLWSDASLSADEKQEQMKAAVRTAGLDVARFNAITRAAKTDEELKARLRKAALTASFG